MAELDPKVAKELSEVIKVMTDALGRLSLLEMELDKYLPLPDEEPK